MTSDGTGKRVVPLGKLEASSNLLRELARGAMKGTDVAVFLGKTKVRAGQVLAELEELDLVRRERDPEDGRAYLWRLTAEGEDALRVLSLTQTTSSAGGWILGVRLGPTGKRVLARGLLGELSPDHVYRVIGDLDFVAVSNQANASPDMLADLRRRLHEAATVEATHIGHIVGN